MVSNRWTRDSGLAEHPEPRTKNREPCVIVSFVKPLGLLLLLSLTLTSCQKTLEDQVREQIRTIDNAELDAEAVEVTKVKQSGKQAIAEVTISTAVRMRKEGDKWILQDVRLGDRRWESVGRILAAIEESRKEQTAREMEELKAGIERYVQTQGEVPRVQSFEELVDLLSPEFLPVVIRIDAWWNPYSYRFASASAYELRSAGPDGEFETADDLVRN